ncbi:MAG TPA: AsmA-like C-terminal domain-containing protein, partial [Geobacteraceae bacterium]
RLVTVQSLQVKAWGGSVAGSGQVDLTAADGPLYRAHFRLDQIDVAQLQQAAGTGRIVTGALAADGEISAQGKTGIELLRSATWQAELVLADGVLFIPAGSDLNKAREIPYQKIRTNLSFTGKTLNVSSASFFAFGGEIAGTGTADFSSPDAPKYLAHYRLKNIAVDQLLRLNGGKRKLTGRLATEGDVSAQGKTPDELLNSVTGQADLELTDGVLFIPAGNELKIDHELSYKMVRASLSFAGRKLNVRSASIDAFGGEITGTGTADFSSPDAPAYQATVSLVRIDSAGFFRAVDATRDLSGLLSMQTDLTASGATVTALKKTLQGSMAIRLEHGVINKFGLLSKVFSVLNVSQLLDFRVPDLVSSGMPYDDIAGTFSFNSGKASISEWSMHSPSLIMTLVGNTDLVSREIDLKIGIQPLQTVGKIVSRIPILGWILTGKSKKFLVVYYEVKGTWDDPLVSTLPETSMTSGIYNIFKRAFRLPGKLLSDPGTVILGQ